MIIRILLLSGLAAIGWLVFVRRNRLPFHIVTMFAMIGSGALAILFPDSTSRLAKALGVGRGADLITYAFEILVMFVLLHYFSRFVELQRQVTELTRELALLRAELERSAAPALRTAADSPGGGRSKLPEP